MNCVFNRLPFFRSVDNDVLFHRYYAGENIVRTLLDTLVRPRFKYFSCTTASYSLSR